MKKRVLCIILTLVMLMGLLPAGAFAATAPYYEKVEALAADGAYVLGIRDESTTHGGTLFTFTQNGTAEGSWSIKGSNGYLVATRSAMNCNSASVSSQASWTITMEDGAVQMQNNTSSKYYILYSGGAFTVNRTSADPIALYAADGSKLTALPESPFEAYICDPDGTKFLSESITADDAVKTISADYVIADQFALEAFDLLGLHTRDVGSAAKWQYRDGKLYSSASAGLNAALDPAGAPDAADYADGKLKIGDGYLTVSDGALAVGAEAEAAAVQVWKYIEPAADENGTYLAITCDIHHKFRSDFAVDSETGEVIGTTESVERMNGWLDKASADFGGVSFEQLVSCGDTGDANTAITGDNYWARVAEAMKAAASHEKVLGGGFFINGNHEWANGQYSSLRNTNRWAKRIRTAGYVEEGEDYILYSLSASSTNNSFESADIAALETFLASEPGDKPIFIVSHFPLHNYNRTEQRRDDLINVLNRYADTLQIIFLWGHNHTEEDPYYGVIYNGDNIPAGMDISPIKFTYCAAGCMTDDEYDVHAVFTKPKGMIAYISPDKTVSLTYYDVNYEVMSTTTLEKPEGHKFVKTDARAATCTEDGIAADCWYCAGCDRYFSDAEGQNEISAASLVTPALGHTWDEGKVTVAPTVISEGVRTFTCTRCGLTKTYRIARIGAGPTDIDFTNTADAELYEIVGQVQSEPVQDEGLALICTRNAIEPCKGRNSGDQATTPEDLVKVPVTGDEWTATLQVNFDTNGGSGGYAFFGFFASEGDDYQNMCGIRGGNNSMQNFERHAGEITHQDEDGVNSSPGFSGNGDYWLRIARAGDTYTCFRSNDGGETFEEMFSYADSGINADSIIIDAYTGMSTGYKFTLKSLTFGSEGASSGLQNIDFTNPADAGKFVVDNQTVSEIKPGEGFYMISTNEAIEDCKGQLSGDAANTPRDTVQVPVEGDWTATLYLKVDTSGSNGQYEFLCLYGMADYDNGCGIRAGNGSTVNFKEVNGVNESSIDGMKVQTGLSSGTDHWYRLEKVGTTYTGYLSADGEDFQKVFTYENTGIEAQIIVIDAYSGRSVGYQYWLQSLTFGEDAPAPCEHDYQAVVTDPTCTGKGYTTYTCSKCGDSYVSDEVAALGHDFGEWTETKAPTCAEAGEETSTCARCGEQQTRAIAALGHDYVDGVCTRCGKEDPNKPSQTYALADSIVAGKSYVIVADGAYAMTNEEVPGKATYSGSSTTRGAKAVSVDGGKLVSEVTDDMLWTFEDSTSAAAYDGLAQYLLRDKDGKYLRRGSMSQRNAALILDDSMSATARYYTWSFAPYEGEDGTYAMYVNSERAYGSDYPGRVAGDETGFDIPGTLAHRDPEDPFAFMNDGVCSRIQLFELKTASTVTETIDFTTTADAGKYAIVAPKQSAVEEGVGLALICSRMSIEPAKRPNSAQYIGAEDTVEIPVEPGDWTATLYLDYDPNNGGSSYAYFSFFASEGDDYQNMLGIRGGNSQMQNFERHDGEVTHEDEDDVSSAPGFSAGAGEYWFRIVKVATSYFCYRSSDGENFDLMFAYEDSGIEATKLIADAYSASSSGNGRKFTLKTLTIEREIDECAHEYVDVVVPPTCYERGYTEHTCTKCGRVYRSDFLPNLEHVWDESKTLIIPPTCTEQGHTERTCSLCGDTFIFDVLDETLHDWPRSGVVIKEPTATERGEQLITCTKCGETKIRPIAAGNEQPHKNEILFISDVHSARNAEEGFHNLRAIMPALREEDGFIPEVISGGGDYIESSTNDTVYWPHCYEVLHDVLYDGFPNSYQTLTSGNHEWEWSRQSDEMIEKLLGEPRVCVGYEADDYAIFHIGAQSNGTDKEVFEDADIAQLRAFLESQAGNGKIIFIQTHWPLHNSYNNSWRTPKNADKMVDLLNEFSDRNDIVFVWGHNHRTDSNRHKFYGRNDVLEIGPSEFKRIKFSYINAGCLNEGHSEQDYGPEGTKYGPGYCLEARILSDRIVLDYAHVYGAYPDPTQAKFDHNADLLYVDTLNAPRESHHEITLLHTGACEHAYVKTHVEPTCADWGKDVYTCSKCGVSYDEVVDSRDEPLGHIWDEGEITTAPTRDDPGVRTYHCERCGGTKTERVRHIGSTLHDDVDFTTAADADKYEIAGQKQSAVEERVGLTLICSRMSIEPAKRPNSDQYIGAEDTVEIPLEPGDWSATLNLNYYPNNGGTSYAYFSFFAAEGDDYQNMLGIRGDNSRMQNFERHDGTVTHEDEDEVSSAPGFTNNPGEYWLRIVKDGDSYYCYRSSDGENFTEMFSYEYSGIEATKLIIDAYSASSSGNGRKFILKSLSFEETCPHEYEEFHHAPTCTQAGYTSKVCKICGSVRCIEDAAPLGHDFVDGKCTRCGTPEGGSSGTMVKEIEAGGSYVIVSNGYALTNQDGAAVGTPVTVDGDSIISEITDAMVWKFNAGESDRCGDYTTGYFLSNGDSDYILARGSSGGSGTAPLNYNTYTAASAKEAGREYYCYWVLGNVDDAGNKGLFLYNNGSGEYAWALRGGETFAAPGRTNSEASALIASNPLKLYEYTGQVGCKHEYTDAVTAPTCADKGFTTHTCTKCGRVFIDGEVAPLGHDIQQTVTAPTCTEAGYTTYTCSRCGESYRAREKEALGHDFVAGVCTRCGAADPNYVPPIDEQVLEELLRLAREALARAEAARQTAEDALAAAEAAGGANLEALEAARAAVQAAQRAAEQAMIQAAAAEAAAKVSDRNAAIKAAEAAQAAAEAAEQAAKAARAQAAAQAAQAAAEAAQAAAEAAGALAVSDKAAVDAARQAAQAARDAAEAAKAAALAAKTDAAEQAAAAAAAAAEAARAQAEAAFAQAAAEAAEAAAKAAQAKAEAAQANAAADQAAAAAAKQAAESAKQAAENAKAAAEAAKTAADGSNTAAAASAAKAAQSAANVAEALAQVADAQAEIAAIKAQAEQSAAQAAAAKAAAEAAQKAAEAALLGAQRYQAEAKLANAVATTEVPAEKKAALAAAADAGMAAIAAAPDKAAIDQALADAIKAVEAVASASESFRFDDVTKPEEQYYFDPVYWAVEKGITAGTSDKLFSPEAPGTRAQVVTFLWRAAGEPEPTKTENPFADVKADAYYYKAVLWAVENGVTKGTSADKFSPDDTCTRAQIVTFLWRNDGKPEPAKTDNPFTDVTADAYYYKAVLWAVENGVTKGTSADKFSPDDTCTRAQIVTFLYREMK